MMPIKKIKHRALLTLLIFVFFLFCLDRYAAYIHHPATDSKAVVIYTTQQCPFCVKLRMDLMANNINYREYDVENGLQGFLGMWALRARSVPVTVIGSNIVYGYRIDEISNAFNRLGVQFIPQSMKP